MLARGRGVGEVRRHALVCGPELLLSES